VVEEFRQDIIHKDGYALTKLVLNLNVLKVANSGLEHWQVRKIDGQWKILSVTWTSYSHSRQPTALQRTRRAYAW
jgi:hypothetical protein